jgi:tetratricopeptide (TPR) repeat protein
MIVEHRMYVALAPLWILVAAGLYLWRPRLSLVVLGAAALAFAAATVARNRDYRSTLALWTDNVAKRPENALARYHLSYELLDEPGGAAAAQAQLEAAVKLDPDLYVAQYNLAALLSLQPGHEDEAIAHYEEVIRIVPGYAEAQTNLAVLFYRRGRLPEATALLEEVVRRRPNSPSAHYNLARLLAADPQKRPEARAEAMNALALDPAFPGAQALLEQLGAAGK